MPSKIVRASLLLTLLWIAQGQVPAQAGWGKRLTNTILPTLLKRAVVALIEKELYDLEEPRAGLEQHYGAVPVSGSTAYGEWKPAPSVRFSQSSAWRRSATDRAPTKALPAYSVTTPPDSSSHHNAYVYLARDSANHCVTGVAGVPVCEAFRHAAAGKQSFASMVANHIFILTPLHGSVFIRHTAVRYIILHSTETAFPADALRVIQSWNNRGLRHPGAQFVVDRDGAIYSTANPDLATVHINTRKALPGYTNDNSIGIEIVRSGQQRYSQAELNSVMYLVAYLQEHYQVGDANITTHHHVQPSDRSDPVGFDLLAFAKAKSEFFTQAVTWTSQHPTLLSKEAVPQRLDDLSSENSIGAQLSQMPKVAPDFRLARRQRL
jgi:N-acetyl-anhydromuramyl-L-alanine amidase AmpD